MIVHELLVMGGSDSGRVVSAGGQCLLKSHL